MTAVRVLREGERYRLTHLAEEVLPFPLFGDTAPREDDCVALSGAMKRLAASIPQTYWPLQVSLPDAAAIVQVMEFEALPKTSRERADIAQFRLAKEYSDVARMQCATQVISSDGEQGLLLAVFVQRAWLDCLNMACRSAGFVPGVIDVSINHLFNCFHEIVQTTRNDGVLIAIDRDTWSMLFWDASHRPRFVRSRWRMPSPDIENEFEIIAKDVERLTMSYALRVVGRRIDTICLCASDDDRASLTTQLEKRMHMPCTQLEVRGNFVPSPGLSFQLISPATFAVAIPRA